MQHVDSVTRTLLKINLNYKYSRNRFTHTTVPGACINYPSIQVTGIVTSQRILLTRFRAPASGSQSLDFQIYGLKEKQNTLECI